MAANTKYNALGFFKDRYADAPAKVLGKYSIFKKDFAFDKSKKTGKYYVQAVQLTRPGGFTYISANATDYTALNTPIAPSVDDAYLEGSEIIGEQYVTYKMLQNAIDNSDSFGNGLDLVVKSIMDEIDRKRELHVIDGSKGLGDIKSSTNSDTTTTVLYFTDRSWSTARWFGTENTTFHIYDKDAALVSSSTNAVFTISAVDSTNKALTVTGTTTGITALDIATAAALAAGEYCTIWPLSSYGKEMKGLNYAATATSTLWGIDASSYSAWKGQTHTLASGEYMDKKNLFIAASLSADKGLTEACTVYLSNAGMAHLLDDMSDYQRFEEKKGRKAYEVGAEGVEIMSPSGMCVVKAHSLLRAGESYLVPRGACKRIGSTEFTWGRPSLDGEQKMIYDVNGYDAIGVRGYCDEAFFCSQPGQIVKLISCDADHTL